MSDPSLVESPDPEHAPDPLDPDRGGFNAKVRSKVCLKVGHKYIAVEDSDSRIKSGNDVLIQRAYICQQCSDVVRPIISVWQDGANWKRPRT